MSIRLRYHWRRFIIRLRYYGAILKIKVQLYVRLKRLGIAAEMLRLTNKMSPELMKKYDELVLETGKGINFDA